MPITNFSFEDPAIAPGSFTTGSINGWNQISGSNSLYGVVYFTTTSVINPTAIDGNQTAALREGSGILGQTLGINLTANTPYTLSIWIGARTDFPYAGYTFGFFTSAGTALVTETNAVTPVAGTWVNRILTFTALTGNPNLGQPLQIRFGETEPSTSSQTVFDKVTLDVVPEPSAVVLTIVGCGGLLALRRRSRR